MQKVEYDDEYFSTSKFKAHTQCLQSTVPTEIDESPANWSN